MASLHWASYAPLMGPQSTPHGGSRASQALACTVGPMGSAPPLEEPPPSPPPICGMACGLKNGPVMFMVLQWWWQVFEHCCVVHVGCAHRRSTVEQSDTLGLAADAGGYSPPAAECRSTPPQNAVQITIPPARQNQLTGGDAAGHRRLAAVQLSQQLRAQESPLAGAQRMRMLLGSQRLATGGALLTGCCVYNPHCAGQGTLGSPDADAVGHQRLAGVWLLP